MAVSLYSVIGFNPVKVQTSSIATISSHISSPLVVIKSRQTIKSKRRQSRLLVADSDRIITDNDKSSTNIESIPPPQNPTPIPSELETSVSNDSKIRASEPKKVPLTARERLRAARVLSRYSESKPGKSEMGRSVLDALRESEKGKKGLPEAPTNLFDDSKRGMPKQGLTFNFPGGFDLFVIAFSFVFISTVMFATTYIVWKLGAIHFNEY